MSPEGTDPLLSARLLVKGWRCVVVGGGAVAARRVQRLVEAGAVVAVVAPVVVDAIRGLPVGVIEREYRSDDLTGATLVVAATGVDEVDSRVVDDARLEGILVNDSTDPSRSTVTFPAVSTVGTITVAVDTGGKSPALASWLRERLADQLSDGVDDLADLMGRVRDELVASGRPTTHPGWRDALDAGLLDLVRQGRTDEARALLRGALGLPR